MQRRHQHGADDGPDEHGHATDVGHQQHIARRPGTHHTGSDDLVVDGGQTAGNAGEHAGGAKSDETDHLRAVAHELCTLGVVSNGVAHAPQRRAREGVHGGHAQQAPRGDEVINLNLRAKADVEQAQRGSAAGRDATLTAKKTAQDQRASGDQFTNAQRDHGKRGARAFGGNPAKNDGKKQTGQATDQGQQGQGDGPFASRDDVERVRRHEPAHAVVHGMAKGQHAGLPQEHVERQRKDDGETHQAHHGERSTTGKNKGQHEQQERCAHPRQEQAARHVSLSPIRPLGRKISTRTKSR